MIIETERKWLVESFIFEKIPVSKLFRIEQFYFKTNNGLVERLRKRVDIHGDETLFFTSKRFIEAGSNEENEREITKREWEELLKGREIHKKSISKNRVVFDYKGRMFEMDIFLSPKNVIILELEIDNIYEQVVLPDYVKIKEEVTGDKNFLNFEMLKLI